MSKSATKMTEVIISVDSKGGYASISRMQSVATKKCIRLHRFASHIESHGFVDLSTYDGSKEYKYKYMIG